MRFRAQDALSRADFHAASGVLLVVRHPPAPPPPVPGQPAAVAANPAEVVNYKQFDRKPLLFNLQLLCNAALELAVEYGAAKDFASARKYLMARIGYLFVTFVLTYGTTQLKLTRDSLLNATLIAAAIGLVSVPFFGYLSDLVGRRLVYGVGIVGTALYAFPYFGLLNTRDAGLVLLAIVLSLLFHDMQYGPQAALIAEGFGPNVRYSGAGMGYQLASVIAGGPAPLIATRILQRTHSSTGISWYIIGCCVLAMAALLLMPRRKAAQDAQVLDMAEAAPVLGTR